METLDNYLEQIQEEVITEGAFVVIGGMMLATFGLVALLRWELGKKIPKHPEWKKIWGGFLSAHKNCIALHQDIKTIATKTITTAKERQGGEPEGGSVTYEEYQENPERMKCIMTVRLNALTDFVTWAKKTKPEVICKDNKKFKRCLKFVGKTKESTDRELKAMQMMLKSTSSKRLLNKHQFKKISKVVG